MARTLAVCVHQELAGYFIWEEANRKTIARILGISERNDFAMLEQNWRLSTIW